MLTKNFNLLRQRVKEHIASDSLIQKEYWNSFSHKGCFIGCLAHSEYPEDNEETYGLPVEVQRLAESIFEKLPLTDAKAFFAAFPDAVECDGKDLSKVHWRFMASELRSIPPQTAKIQGYVDRVIWGMDLLASGKEWVAAEFTDFTCNPATAAAMCASRTASRAKYGESISFSPLTANIFCCDILDCHGDAYSESLLRQRDNLLRLIKRAPVLEETSNA